ncbi:MAG: outer membrane lipoprotein carrier protein LolA [Desulfobacterales bacterium]
MEKLKKEGEGVISVRAGFTQKKHMKILAKPLVSKGVVLFKRPKSVRWEYLEPVKSILLMDKGRVRRFIESDTGMVEDTGAGVQIMQFVLQEISFWLGGNFDRSPNFSSTLLAGRTIMLQPKEESFSQVIERIELKLSDIPGVMDRVTIFESEGSYTVYTFHDTTINPAIDDSLFRDM